MPGSEKIRRQLLCKGRRNACPTIVADRWFPSSKTCSDCGATKAKLPLHVRVFTCDLCGLVIDRDENAARNLAALAAARTTGPGVAGDQDTPRVSKPRGADRETRRQHPGQTPAGADGQMARACRTSGKRKRETAVRTPKHNPRRGDTDTDLPDGNIWKAESH
uniref:Transposase n=1 Tax=Streptomyces sp. NBC_00180 TaxID=2903632 RepID=A0AAU1IB44_9ACTN